MKNDLEEIKELISELSKYGYLEKETVKSYGYIPHIALEAYHLILFNVAN